MKINITYIDGEFETFESRYPPFTKDGLLKIHSKEYYEHPGLSPNQLSIEINTLSDRVYQTIIPLTSIKKFSVNA